MGLLLLILALWLVVAVAVRIARWRPPPPRPLVTAPARRAVRHDVPHALYDYLRPDGSVRYVGISNEPPARDRRHATNPDDQWWYQQTTKVMHVVRWYHNRAAALAAECNRVRTLALAGHPLANDHHNPVRRSRRAA